MTYLNDLTTLIDSNYCDAYEQKYQPSTFNIFMTARDFVCVSFGSMSPTNEYDYAPLHRY
jgi:hypothetical protein